MCYQATHREGLAPSLAVLLVNDMTGPNTQAQDEQAAYHRSMRDRYGFDKEFNSLPPDPEEMIQFINLKLHARGLPIYGKREDYPFFQLAESLLTSTREKNRLLAKHLCPADQHIQNFLESYLEEVRPGKDGPWVPNESLVLERHGLARLLSLPPNRDSFESDIIKSYRVKQGVCHNPKRDRRTTKGVFHICEGGLPIPADKFGVPKVVFANLLEHALNPPAELLRLPFTDAQEEKAETFCSLMLRPLVAPGVPGVAMERRLEVRFFAPGNLVANLDFVESIFGNAGDPFLPENDARLDVDHWSGHTGCVILAPHLCKLTKKEVGLPNIADATDKQKKDGMCWASEDELYNGGTPFKLCARDNRGVMVTMIADNYFGYCKKEVKTMISFAANLYGLAEEEHAGGALVFPAFDHGEEFHMGFRQRALGYSFDEMVSQQGSQLELKPEGYAVDRKFSNVLYVPEDAHLNLRTQLVTWQRDGQEQTIPMLPGNHYILPSGYKLSMEKPWESQRWRIVGNAAIGTLCHKPCTVSGGGKSEISKSLNDAMVSGTVYIRDLKADFDKVETILNHDFSNRYKEPREPGKPGRALLDMDRSLGSVIKMLNTNPLFTDEHNQWISDIRPHIRDLVLVVKRFYKEHWGENWRERFSVNTLNGKPSRELKYFDDKIVTKYLRVGFEPDGSWRTFTLRKDFMPAQKIQTEDDISVSITIPSNLVPNLDPDSPFQSCKFLQNCEHRLFQRPDDAILRGYDKTAENDFCQPGNFFSNYNPLPAADAAERLRDAIHFDLYTEGIQELIVDVEKTRSPDYYVLPSDPRILDDGSICVNPRYLQNRPDLQDPKAQYLAELGTRLHRRIPPGESVPIPVDAVLPGRRHNPPDEAKGIRALAVYNPIHYQELPELFIDYIASLTGKSPSTTGAGSEGALTKRPFNALPPIVDLNNALVSHMVTGHPGFVTTAGYVGPKVKVNHDISLLVPELWSRLRPFERDPAWLIEHGYLDKIEDFEHEGKPVLASRLGYRINREFVHDMFGRVFSTPSAVLTDEMLKPELQDLDIYVDGLQNIVETSTRVAMEYFEDGSVEFACPPLKALLHIMAHGEYEGRGLNDPAIRELFNPATILDQDWYKARLDTRVKVNKRLNEKHIEYLEAFLEDDAEEHDPSTIELVKERLALAKVRLAEIIKPDYLQSLVGTIGADPMLWLE